MCGIAGVLGGGGAEREAGRVRSMIDALRHRGPDGEGVWASPGGRAVLGHRRLAVLDLSAAGSQPMSLANRYHLVFNGEIYNYLELREELEAAGHRFRTRTDTEVLLAAFAEYGPVCLERLDGMFAFAVFDEAEQTLFCARDRFGEKPFFYRHAEGRPFLFASEMKALFAGGHPAEVDEGKLFQFLAYDSLASADRPEATFFRGIRRLPPAHSLTIRPGGPPCIERYWRIPRPDRRAAMPYRDACDRFLTLLSTSVSRRLRSDVPLGSSLSGGLDSSTIVRLIAERAPGAEQHTFSARFDDPALDEGRWIDLVTRDLDVRRHEVSPDPDALADELPRIFNHQEEPFGSSSVLAQWDVMKLANRRGITVLLDGQGADETLAGYLRYFRVLFTELLRTAPERLPAERAAYERLHPGEIRVPVGLRPRLEARVPGVLRFLGGLRRIALRPGYLSDLAPDFRREHRTTPPSFAACRTVDEALVHDTTAGGLAMLLRYADRNSMAFSREVRLPFLSHELVEFLFTLPTDFKIRGGWTKRILRTSTRGLLPRALRRRRDKLGFRPPEESWLARPGFRERTADAVSRLRREGILGTPREGREWAYLMAAQLVQFAEGWRSP